MDTLANPTPAAPVAASAPVANASLSESPAINELAAALAKAQGAFSNPEKDRRNPHFGNSYATLGAVIETTRKALADNGLSLTQTVGGGQDGRPPLLRTRLLHASGQWLASEVPLFAAGKGSQVFGSELTYMRRYAACALLNIAPAEGDDDGNAAQAAAGAGGSASQAPRNGPRPGNGAEPARRPQDAGNAPSRAPAKEPERRPGPDGEPRQEPSASPGQPATLPKGARPQESTGTSPRQRKDEPSPPSAWSILRPGKAAITAPDGAAWLKWWSNLAAKAKAEGKRDGLRTLYDANTAAWDDIALASPETEAVVAQAGQAVRAVLDA